MENSEFVLELTDATFAEQTKEGLTLIDFWAPWCGPCRMQGPIIEEIGRDYQNRVRVAKLNTDENQQTAFTLKVMSIPTLMLYRDGELVDKRVGVQGREALEEWLDEHLA